MAITVIRKVPYELPYARLYLDDVEEITRVLVEAYEPVFTEQEKKVVPVCYLLGGDIRVDSIEDLQNRGGSTREFGIQVGSWVSPAVELRGLILEPRIFLPLLDEPQQWVVYGRIKAIFDGRRMAFRHIAAALPAWLRALLYLVVFASFGVFASVALHGSLKTRIAVAAGYLLLFSFVYLAYVASGRVFFVRSHERSRVSAESRRRTVRDVILIIIGAIAGAVAGVLASKYLK